MQSKKKHLFKLFIHFFERKLLRYNMNFYKFVNIFIVVYMKVYATIIDVIPVRISIINISIKIRL